MCDKLESIVKVAVLSDEDLKRMAWYNSIAIANILSGDPKKSFDELFHPEVGKNE